MRSFDRGDVRMDPLMNLPVDWSRYPSTAPDLVAERIRSMQIAITNKVVIDRETIERSPALRLVLIAATGTDNVDLSACAARNITVCNVRQYATPSVVQHTIGLMLNLLTRQYRYVEDVRSGAWSRNDVFCLLDHGIVEAEGKVFGVIGHGTLGKRTADIARAFGMEVIVAGRKGAEPSAGRVGFDHFLQLSDVVSIHCPLTPGTRNLIGKRELALMKPDAFLINTARGAIIDPEALASALRGSEIAGAGIDVLESEPPGPAHTLLQGDIPNLIVTPHNAWGSKESRQRLVSIMSDIVVAWISGSPINAVT